MDPNITPNDNNQPIPTDTSSPTMADPFALSGQHTDVSPSPNQAVPPNPTDSMLPPESSTQPQTEVPAQNISPIDTTPSVFVSSNEEGQGAQQPNTGGKSSGSTKKVVAGVVIFLMLVGIGAGVFVLKNQQTSRTAAWDCTRYTFNVAENGDVTVLNSSGKQEAAQQVNVFIDGDLANTLDVPALSSGDGATIGRVDVPSGGFNWRVVGTLDCQNSGDYEGEPEIAQCQNLIVYDNNWEALSTEDLKLLVPGDTIRIAVSGTTTSGNFEAARFTINGELQEETIETRPGTEEFYQEYVIPEDVESFTFNAELKHSGAGWF